MTKAQRYYAKWDNNGVGSVYTDGWLIYDRDYTTRQGADLPIALAAAFRIRDALNSVETLFGDLQ